MRTLLSKMLVISAGGVLGAFGINCSPGLTASVAPIWNFSFEDGISGAGRIVLDVNDVVDDNDFLVTSLVFSLDFNDGQGVQNLTLSSFNLTAPLRFDPFDTSKELTSTPFNTADWLFGIVPGGGIVNLTGDTGIGLPPDPPGIGGAILFVPGSTPTVGTWTAQAIPEPTTILGAALALSFSALARRTKGNGVPD